MEILTMSPAIKKALTTAAIAALTIAVLNRVETTRRLING